jgi:hypothetical protein
MSINKKGFIVAGYLDEVLTPESARKVAVLSVDQDSAIDAVSIAYPNMTTVGVVSEDQIKEDIVAIDMCVNAGEYGYVIGGYTGNEFTSDSALKIAVSALDEETAVLLAIKKQQDFHPLGAASKNQLMADLSMIKEFKLNENKQ